MKINKNRYIFAFPYEIMKEYFNELLEMKKGVETVNAEEKKERKKY